VESLKLKLHARPIQATLITRRTIAVAAVMLLAVVLAACGGTPTATPAPTSAPTAEPEPTDTEAAAEAPTEAPTAETVEEVVTEEAEADEPAGDAGEEAAIEGPYVTIANVTSVRSGPGTGFEMVAGVDVNETFPVIAQTGSGLSLWYLITMPDGEPAWVWSRVVVLTPADAEIEPAATVPAAGS
jgi:hypothetical protein